jgi:hypothetical protein
MDDRMSPAVEPTHTGKVGPMKSASSKRRAGSMNRTNMLEKERSSDPGPD